VPPLPGIRHPALAALADDLRRSPRRRLLEQIDRAEALVCDIDPEQSYPVAFLVYRLTGYRPEHRGALPGTDLLADLSALVVALCAAAKLTEADLPEGSLSREELAARWSVSARTVDRATRRGLLARRVADGRNARLHFTPAAVSAYEGRAGAALERARGFRRLDEAERDRLLRRARRYRRRLGWTLNAAAVRLSRRFGRSHEGVRDLLLRHDAAERVRPGGRPIFPAPRVRDRALRFRLLRAARDGAEPADLGARAGADARAAQRLVAGLRLVLLQRLDLAGPTSPVFDRDDAAEVLLGPEAARLDLPVDPADGTLAGQLAAARVAASHPPDRERTAATALAFLRARALRSLDAITAATPPASTLDRIETDLAWAILLRTRLVAERFGTVVRTVEDLAGPLDAHGERGVHRLVRAGLLAAATAAEQHPAWRGGRLAAAITLAVTRALPRARALASATGAGRALPASAPAIDLARAAVRPTEVAALGFDPRVRAAWLDDTGPMPPEARRALGRRTGWDGAGPPLTLDELAAELGTTRMWAARRVRAAVRATLCDSTSGPPGA